MSYRGIPNLPVGKAQCEYLPADDHYQCYDDHYRDVIEGEGGSRHNIVTMMLFFKIVRRFHLNNNIQGEVGKKVLFIPSLLYSYNISCSGL